MQLIYLSAISATQKKALMNTKTMWNFDAMTFAQFSMENVHVHAVWPMADLTPRGLVVMNEIQLLNNFISLSINKNICVQLICA